MKAELEGVFPAGTEFQANGVAVRLDEKTKFTLIGINNYDVAAERCGIGRLEVDWTHKETDEDGRTLTVRYGPQGDRLVEYDAEPEPVRRTVEPVEAEKPKAKKKK